MNAYKLVDIGVQTRWWCPCCGELKTKPTNTLADGTRWHSVRCKKPLERVNVAITAVSS